MPISKKVFWPIFAIVFVIITVFIFNSIYYSKIVKALDEAGIDTSGLSKKDIMSLISVEKSDIEVHDNVYTCEKDDSVKSRAYIILLGFKNHDKNTFVNETALMEKNPNVKGIFTYDYNENLTLDEISVEFILQANAFISEMELDELIIIGSSAGGNVAVNSIDNISFDGEIELHTIASPLNGYGLKGIKERLIGERDGLEREIAYGFEPFKITRENIKTYHHKTVEDESLLSKCGAFVKICNTLQIQNNNVEGSKDFYYQDRDHKTIMNEVIGKIIDCH